MPLDLESIIKKLGWEDGFQIPVANAENKALEEELAKLTLWKIKTKAAYENSSRRFEDLKNHNKFVLQENEQNQKLIVAHKQQFENEENQYILNKAEKNKLEQDFKQVTKNIKELNERQEIKKESLQKSIAKVEKLKGETKWDEEALTAWEEALKKRDDDNELFKKFSKEDASRYNELEAKRQNLQTEYFSKNQTLGKILCEYNNYEMIIDRTGKMIKKQIAERDALINQWKDTVKILQLRDNDIEQIQTQLMENQEIIEKHEAILEENNTFLMGEERNNHALDMEIHELNVYNSRTRRDFNELVQYVTMLTSELNASKRSMAATAQQQENIRMHNKQLKKKIEDREEGCKAINHKLVKLQRKLHGMKTTSSTIIDRVQHLETLIDNEQKQQKNYLGDSEKLQNLLYRSEQQLKDQTEIGKIFEIKINNCLNNVNQYKKHIKDLSKTKDNLTEIIYDLDCKTDILEQKLLDLESCDEGSLEEKEKYIANLETTLSDHTDVSRTLQLQLNRIQEEMQRLNNVIAAEKEQLQILRVKCENGILIYEMGLKQLTGAKQSSQEKQVEENLARLRVNNMENDVKKEQNNIFSLQKFELSMEEAMRERQLEISTTQAILHAKRRNLDEDRGRLKADIAIRHIKIEQFQKKYHIALMSLGKNDDGQQLSITHFKIKHAQEKFLLQKEGDELDQRIKTAEKEIIAMENTLKVVNLTNCAFKQSLGPVNDNDKEVAEMKLLEKQLRDINSSLKEHTKMLNASKQETIKLQSLLAETDSKRTVVKNQLDKMKEECELISTQEQSKGEKLERAQCQLKKIAKKLDKKKLTNFDRDFEIRQMRDANKNVLQRFVDMTMEYQDVAPLINRYVAEYKIKLPAKKWTPSTSTDSTYSTPSVCSASSSHESMRSQSSSLNKVVLSLDL